MQIKKELQKNKQVMQEAFRDCGDIIMREFRIRGGEGTLFLAYTDNIVNGDAIQNFIMTNVMARCEMQGTEGLLQSLMEEVIAIGELTKITTMEEVFDAVLLGDTVLLMDGDDFALQASTKHFPTRGVNQAETEVVVQGPKDAFTELMSVNVVLTRRRIRDTRLKVKRKKVGRRSKTDVALLYMEDLVRPELLQKIERQVDCLDFRPSAGQRLCGAAVGEAAVFALSSAADDGAPR